MLSNRLESTIIYYLLFSDVKDVTYLFVNELTVSVICKKNPWHLGSYVRSNAQSIVFSAGGGSGQHTSEIARKVLKSTKKVE